MKIMHEDGARWGVTKGTMGGGGGGVMTECKFRLRIV